MTLAREALGDFGFVLGGYYLLVILLTPANRHVYQTCAEFHITSMRGLIGSSIQRTLSSRLFRPRLSYVRRFRMLTHTKGGMVQFQRAYHHGCFTHVYYTCTD